MGCAHPTTIACLNQSLSARVILRIEGGTCFNGSHCAPLERGDYGHCHSIDMALLRSARFGIGRLPPLKVFVDSLHEGMRRKLPYEYSSHFTDSL